MKHGEADETLVRIFGDWIFASPITEAVAIIGMVMYRNIVNVDADVFGAQCAKDRSAAHGDLFQIEANGIQVPRRVYLVSHHWFQDCALFAEGGRIASCNFSPTRQVCLQLPQLREPKGASDISEPIIKTER